MLRSSRTARGFLTLLAAVLIALCANNAFAQVPARSVASTVASHDSTNAAAIHWLSNSFVPPAQSVDAQLHSLQQDILERSDDHFVIQFTRPLTQTDRRAIDALGVTLLSAVSPTAYFAVVNERLPALQDTGALQTFGRAWQRSGIPSRSIAPIQRSWKIHPRVSSGEVPAWLSNPSNQRGDVPRRVAVYAMLHGDVDLTAAVNRLGKAPPLDIEVIGRVRSINTLVLELPQSAIDALADDDAVMWIEWPLPPLETHNLENRQLTQVEQAQAPPYSLDGSGVTAMVYDAGTARATHVDFGGRLSVHDSTGTQRHATHVACTVGGDGAASDGAYRGMAPAVTLLSYGYEPVGSGNLDDLYADPGDIENDYNEAINTFGADVVNNSIGTNVSRNFLPCDWEGDYGVTAALIDAIALGSLGKPFLQVWAAGNERGFPARCGSLYATTPPPSMSKNALVVGAVNADTDTPAGFSSFGPADDGRIRPSLVAPGAQTNGDGGVTSCGVANDTDYDVLDGTSMAAPTVTGIVALLLQDYRDDFPTRADPSPAFVRAVLSQTAVDILEPGPDYRSGYGSVRAVDAIDFMRRDTVFSGAVGTAETLTLRAFVPPDDTTLKLTLVWDDAVGTPNVVPNLVNDLDMLVTDPDGLTHHPWTLDPENPSLPAVTTSPDHANNIEQIAIDAPTPGLYIIDIAGHAVPDGRQSFVLASSQEIIVCDAAATLTLSQPRLACEDAAEFHVVDCDLNQDDFAVEEALVVVASDSEPAGELIVLTETGTATGHFAGTIPVSQTDAAGTLLVSPDDAVTAVHIDVDDGTGQAALVTFDTTVDCAPPMISDVAVGEIGPDDSPFDAVVSFAADEPVRTAISFGSACDALDMTTIESHYAATPMIRLTNLLPARTYFFTAEVTDEVGNTAAFDNGGVCYAFTTPQIDDYFTELFDNGTDLEGLRIEFTPDDSSQFYAACIDTVGDLPVDTAGANEVSLGDDASAQALLSDGQQVSLYGQAYPRFFINSNGHLTFLLPDINPSVTRDHQFDAPRISPLLADLNPSVLGSDVSWQQLEDRAVVTFDNVPTAALSSRRNTFQVEMFFDGRIAITWLGVLADEALVGLSRGTGIPEFYLDSDVSAATPCNASLAISLPDGDPPVAVAPDEVVSLTVQIEALGESLVADSARLMVRLNDDAPFLPIPLVPQGGTTYEAVLPAFDCMATPSFYLAAAGTHSSQVTLPPDAPATLFRATVGTSAIGTLLSQRFEFPAGLPAGWSADGLWRVTDECVTQPLCEGSSFAYYGQGLGCNYDTGAVNSGRLRAPLIALPPDGPLTLSYCSNLETEDSGIYDKARLLVNDELVDLPGPPFLQWEQRQVDLSAFAGQAIALVWEFDTVDANNNDYLGWQVDQIELTAPVLTCQDQATRDGLSRLAACIGGPGIFTPPLNCGADDFSGADRDEDGDVDLRDVQLFLQSPSTP